MSETEQQPSAPEPSEDDEVTADVPTLPAELMAEAQAVFAMFSDGGGGGRMNVMHLYAALRANGVDATDQDVIAVVDEHDPTGRGYITRDQWTASMARRWAEDVTKRRRFRAMLAAGDPTSTGRVTVDHVRAALKEFDPNLRAVDVNEMVESMDFAGSGLIDYDEFMNTMVRPIQLD